MTDFDKSYIVSEALNYILDLASTAYSLADEFGSKGKSGKALSDFRDNLNMSAFIIDNAIIEIAVGILAIWSDPVSARILLDSSGTVTIKGNQYKGLTLTSSLEVTTPTLAVIENMVKAENAVSVTRALADLAQDCTKFGIKMKEMKNGT
jgi:hypothetical protein